MSERWYFDALDVRAGAAFVSHRRPDAALGRLELELPAMHFAAPDFAAHPLASRALGQAAGRGAFQAGLFVDGAEVGFDRLDDAIEFTRRAYLRGDGGPDPDGGEPEPAPEPPVETDGERSPAEAVLLRLLELFAEAAAAEAAPGDDGVPPSDPPASAARDRLDLEPVRAAGSDEGRRHSVRAAATPTRLREQGRLLAREAAGDSRKPLALAAAAVAHGLAWRSARTSLDDVLGSARNVRAFGRLGWAVGRLELGPLLSEQPAARILADADALLAGIGPLPPLRRILQPGWGRPVWDQAGSLEPYADLADWPVPGSTARRLGLRRLHHDLAEAVGAVAGLPPEPNVLRPLDLALLLFGLVHLHTAAAPVRRWEDLLPGAVREAAVVQSLAWFSEELPALVYPSSIESLLRSTDTASAGGPVDAVAL